MAYCIHSLINEPFPDAAIACMVHAVVWPCPRDGEPASPVPLHADTTPSREATVKMWEIRVARQRPLIIHRGDVTDGTHELSEDCLCHPEALPAESRESV